jgi:hypothetical protein
MTAMIAASAFMVTPAHANLFGGRTLHEPCCGGDGLWGSSSSITISVISPDAYNCIAFRNDAEDGGPYNLLQAGLLRCGVSMNIYGTCSLYNNLVRFVEVRNSSGHHCYAHGDVSSDVEHDTAVQAYSGQSWTSWIDGVYYEGNTQSHAFIAADVEYTGSGCDGWSLSGTFGSGSAYPWQRLRPDRMTWYTIQSAFTSADCMTVAGGPPGAFSVYR